MYEIIILHYLFLCKVDKALTNSSIVLTIVVSAVAKASLESIACPFLSLFGSLSLTLTKYLQSLAKEGLCITLDILVISSTGIIPDVINADMSELCDSLNTNLARLLNCCCPKSCCFSLSFWYWFTSSCNFPTSAWS